MRESDPSSGQSKRGKKRNNNVEPHVPCFSFPSHVIPYAKTPSPSSPNDRNICFQVTHRIACQSISIFINLSGRTATAAASNLLLLRTIALWKWNPWVVWPMYALSVGQWALYLHNVFIVREVWSEADKSCIVQSVGDTPIKVQFIYSEFFVR